MPVVRQFQAYHPSQSVSAKACSKLEGRSPSCRLSLSHEVSIGSLFARFGE
ncbi:hypothetical protein RchiOBHm_Chr0c44g0503681 [Rosa chinensis]|uniref:Uncharacterized protein n=1 Tax=Rosa chinensis TaxID=74649 RepID=A0A2P6SQ06_ROSCH|nr:hypothetical protein RchiOBHm_Chr0c44g0503681 [Rosa chinensis]